jgi:hypothetical protein
MRFPASLALVPLLPFALAQAPFPIGTKTDFPSSVATKISSDFSSYFSSVHAESAWSSLVPVMQTATGLPDDQYRSAAGDPAGLGYMFFTATATPTWYPALPSNLQSFVSSVAAAQASIVNQDAGSGAEGAHGRVVVWGAVLAAGIVGLALL